MNTPEIRPFVDVELSWRRESGGPTAILRRGHEDAPWTELARVDGDTYTARGVDPGRTSIFAAAGVLPDGGLVAEDEWEILRVAPLASEGRPDRPATPTGLAVAQDGPRLNLFWDQPADGLTVSWELRQGATWENALVVARELRSTCYSFPWWASGSVTLWLAAIDRHGRQSIAKASAAVTIAAIDTHVTTGTTNESGGGWGGTKTDTEVSGSDLQLVARPRPFGSMTDPFGSYSGSWASIYKPSGTYESGVINAGQVEAQRIEVSLSASHDLASLPFGSLRMSVFGRRTTRDGTPVRLGTRSWCGRQTWQGAALLAPDVLVEIDTSQTNAGAWDGWRRWVPGTYTFWRCRLRVTLTGDGFRRLKLPTLSWTRRKYNHKDEGVIAVPGGAATPVTFTAPFTVAPRVTVGLLGGSGILGPRIDITAVTKTACAIEVFDDTGASVAADVHWHALGV